MNLERVGHSTETNTDALNTLLPSSKVNRSIDLSLNMAKKYRVVSTSGEPCINCGKPTEVREHDVIRDKQLKQPYYFTRWFNCYNPNCNTTIFMKEEFKVWNNNKASKEFKLVAEDIENQARIRDL